MKKVLITGGSGLVGRELITQLSARRDIDNIILLTRNTGKIKLKEKIIEIYGDLRTPGLNLSSEAKSLISGINEAYHLAANTSLKVEDREDIFQTNVNGTRNLLELIAKDLPMFNYVSSAYACGVTNDIVKETWLEKPTKFRNPYEESKWVAENLIRDYSKEQKLPFHIYRPSILAHQNPSIEDLSKQTFYAYAAVISRAGKINHTSQPIKLPGEKNSQINIIFLEEVVKLMLQTRQDSGNNIFNLANDSNLSVQNLINIVGKINNCSYQLDSNLRLTELTRAEKYAYKRVLPFTPYLENPAPVWSMENTVLSREKLGIMEIDEEQIKENLEVYLKK